MIQALVLGAAAALLGAAHPNSFSWSNIVVRQGHVKVELRVQVLSVGEVVEGFDDDLDGSTDPDELAAAADDILRYCAQHYRVVPGAEGDAAAADAGRALALDLDASKVDEGPLIPDPMNVVADWIDVTMVFESPADSGFEQLGVYVDLFQVTSPGHRDGCTVRWNGEDLEDVWNFAESARVHVFTASPGVLARNAPALERFALSGALGLPSRSGLTLLAFGLMLVATVRRRPLWGVIGLGAALFTAAAGAMIAAPALPPARVEGSEGFVDWAIALGLVYLAIEDLSVRAPRARWLEAAVFGILLGLEEALRLSPEIRLEEPGIAPFVGHALGAMGLTATVILGLAVTLGRRSGGRGPDEQDAVAPFAARRILAVGALALAGWRLLELV